MIRNVYTNSDVVEENTSLTKNISEYRIGHTTYVVETHFNLECGETLIDVLKRLMIREIQELSQAA